jgi:hypothetical protein
MARNQVVVECPAGVWTELTNANADEITFQVLAGAVEVRATVGATAPSATDRGYFYRSDGQEYHEGELRIEIAEFTLAAGANRVFARPTNARPARIIVDHADA